MTIIMLKIVGAIHRIELLLFELGETPCVTDDIG
jgi:hypothetical protein